MGKIFDNKVMIFNKGMTNDPRIGDTAHSRVIKHFDASTFPHKLVPYRSSENGSSTSATDQIANFIYDSGTFYGYGVSTSVPTTAALYSKSDFTNATWTEIIGIASSNRTTADLTLFIGYHSLIYGVRGGRYVWKINPSGPSALNNEQDLTAYTTVSNGIVHSKDDILYFGYDNKIARNNAGSWTTPALTLPMNKVITSICEYGNYLAIGCKSANTNKSTVYLWDRDSSLTTLSESIDWGEGDLNVLDVIEGRLVGVSFLGSNSTSFAVTLLFKYYAGNSGAVKFAELDGTVVSGNLKNFKQKIKNKILFTADITINGTRHAGIWAVALQNNQFTVTFDRLVRNDTALTNEAFYGFYQIGDYMFATYDNGGFGMTKTDDQANYSATSIYESIIFNTTGSQNSKALLGAALSCEALPITGSPSLSLYYRKDGATAWTLLFTYTTVGGLGMGATTTSAGAYLGSHNEVEFRIEATGGAVPTGLYFKEELSDENPY